MLSIEIRMLAFAVALGIVQLLLATQASTSQRGLKWNLSARDQKPPELTGIPARLDRAFKNFMETFPFFVAAVLAVQVSQQGNSLTALGAELYLIARIVYLPLYVLGIPVVRTLTWLVSMVGICMVLSALF